jgi:hypothetical protein
LFNFKEGGKTILKCSPLRGISVVYSYAGSIKGNLQCIHNVLETNGFPWFKKVSSDWIPTKTRKLAVAIALRRTRTVRKRKQ